MKDQMNEQSLLILKMKGLNYNIWKPAKLKLSKAVRDVVGANTHI